MVSKLRLERLKKEITQIDLWMVSGVPQWRISLIERGIFPKVEEKEKIARALDCRVSDIFPETERT